MEESIWGSGRLRIWDGGNVFRAHPFLHFTFIPWGELPLYVPLMDIKSFVLYKSPSWPPAHADLCPQPLTTSVSPPNAPLLRHPTPLQVNSSEFTFRFTPEARKDKLAFR